MGKYALKEIEEKLAIIDDVNDPFIHECRQDERKNVQKLIEKWQKQKEKEKLAKELFEQMAQLEKQLWSEGFQTIAGIDEVGRGPLAGPVVAAAVILPHSFYLPGLNDSKKLSAVKREELYEKIINEAISVGIGVVHADEIDQLNIYRATKKAMVHAVNHLSVFPDFLLIDAMDIDAPIPQQKLVKGDERSISIASASIVAKVYRDRLMKEYSKQYPMYHFEKNMGYGTKEHLQAIYTYGPSPIHRKSFAPIKDYGGE